jgi:hypothetical protein
MRKRLRGGIGPKILKGWSIRLRMVGKRAAVDDEIRVL